MATQEKLNTQGRKYIAQGRATVAQLWRKACDHDGIPYDSQFVVFSENNPWAPWYNKAMAQYLEACRQYEAGGYVGLSINH